MRRSPRPIVKSPLPMLQQRPLCLFLRLRRVTRYFAAIESQRPKSKDRTQSLLSGRWDPVAMKARRNTVRNLNDGLRIAGEILSIQDHKVGCLLRHVHHISE